VQGQLHGHGHTVHAGRRQRRRRSAAGRPRLAARVGRARRHRARDHGRVPDGRRRRARAHRRDDGGARRRPHPGARRHHERAHADRRPLQPPGGGAGRRRADDPAAVLLHADRGRDLRLLPGDRGGRDGPDHALQQPRHLQRRHAGDPRGPADARLREHPLHQGGEHGRRSGLRRDRGDRRRHERLRGRADRRVLPARCRRVRQPVRQLPARRLVADLGPARGRAHRRRAPDPGGHHPHRPRHRRGTPDLRAPVLLQGARRRGRPSGGRRAAAADDVRAARRGGRGPRGPHPADDGRARRARRRPRPRRRDRAERL
ncbi:MAG: 4-hydroxy-tetrahydrodipicolinate synthase, partial [uncultured Solirubrobacteraceae bacterium]